MNSFSQENAYSQSQDIIGSEKIIVYFVWCIGYLLKFCHLRDLGVLKGSFSFVQLKNIKKNCIWYFKMCHGLQKMIVFTFQCFLKEMHAFNLLPNWNEKNSGH